MTAQEKARSVVEAPRQEIRRMGWVARHLMRMSPAGICWVRSWMDSHFDVWGGQRKEFGP